MCGRFVASSPVSVLAEEFAVEEVKVDDTDARYNVAPTNEVVAIAESSSGTRQLGSFKWGLVPSWSKDPSSGNRMINLRAETVSDKPSFKKLLATHRCIVPADGFYEWKQMGKGRKKQPFFIRGRDGKPLALAGLWAAWRERGDEDAEWLRTCTIITTEPNTLVGTLHDRMPVVLPPATWDTWLDKDITDVERLRDLLVPAPDDMLELWPVGTEVNNVRNEGPELTLPLEGHD